jgi:hypothetical protein
MASGVPAGVKRFGINELITTMPAVSGEKPNGFFAQAPPVCAFRFPRRGFRREEL